MRYIFLHGYHLRKVYLNYYFNYKALVYEWWRQSLPYSLKHFHVFLKNKILYNFM